MPPRAAGHTPTPLGTPSPGGATDVTVLTDEEQLADTGSKQKDTPSEADAPIGSVGSLGSRGSSLNSIVSKAAPSFQVNFWKETRKARKMLKRAKASSKEEYRKERSKVLLRCTPKQWKSKSARAKTAFFVDKLKSRIRTAAPNHVKVSTEAAVALASALDYCVSELLDVACKAADLKKQGRITPRHIKLGVPQDESLNELFRNVTIPQGGVVPHFHPELATGYRKPKRTRYQDEPAPAKMPSDKASSSPSYDKKASVTKAKDSSSPSQTYQAATKKPNKGKDKDSAEVATSKKKDSDVTERSGKNK
jgi:histone H2A